MEESDPNDVSLCVSTDNETINLPNEADQPNSDHSQSNASSDGSELSSNHGSANVGSIKVLTAELVDPSSELEHMERKLLKAIKDDPVVAEVVTDPTRSKLRLRSMIVALVTLVLAAVATIVILLGFRKSDATLAPTMAPTLPPEERAAQIVEFINKVTLSNHAIEYPAGDSATPEEQAIAWMIDDDLMQLMVADEERFLQRFALVCLLKSNPANELGASWLQSQSECLWSGVECSTTGAVTRLDLEGKGLTAKLPEDFGLLSHIQGINLESNGMSGTIPESISWMTDLEVFKVAGNELSGTVPWDALLNMTNLEVSSIGENILSGPLPPKIGDRWPNLEVFFGLVK